jgi:hypothetical protein
MTMRDYVLYACAFMILSGLTMIVILTIEKKRLEREREWRRWMEHEETGLVEVVLDPADHDEAHATIGERLRMLDGQEPTR